MNSQTKITIGCTVCGVIWPCEPLRPKLSSCDECRREYKRRWSAAHYSTDEGQRARRQNARDYYARNRNTFNDRHLRRALKDLSLSLEAYEQMLKDQGGQCAICGEVESGRFSRLAIDHNHATGEVRGLLCGRCNKAIGLLRDDPEIVMNTLKYLTREEP